MKNQITYQFFFKILPLVFLFTNSLAQTFTDSNLPIVVINTNGGTIVNEPKIVVDMKIIFNSNGARNYLTGTNFDYNGKAGIEFRGSFSQQFPKKSYGFELRTTVDPSKSLNAPLLGMSSESDWVLNASYYDQGFLRNVLTYDLYRQTGRYSPNTRFCEVVINGQYQGLYILTEKIKRDVNRVNIAKLSTSDNSLPNLSGGYLIESNHTDIFPNGKGWESTVNSQLKTFEVKVPSSPTLDQLNYIKDYFLTFEQNLKTSNYSDPVNGFRKYIDDDSFIDYIIFQEFTLNNDAYFRSQYFYKDRGQKMFASPLWDFDASYGSGFFNSQLPNRWIVGRSETNPQLFWPARMLQDCDFKSKLKSRYLSVRNNILSYAAIEQKINTINANLAEAKQRDGVKWNPGIPQQDVIFFNNTRDVNLLKSWISQRLTWMDANIDNISNCGNVSCDYGTPFSVVSASYAAGSINYVFNASNLYNAKWQVKKDGNLVVESPVFTPTSNTLTASTGTLAAGNYEFVLLGVGGSYPNQTPCTGSATKSFSIGGNVCNSPSVSGGGSICSNQTALVVANGCTNGNIRWYKNGNPTTYMGISVNITHADFGTYSATCTNENGSGCTESLKSSTTAIVTQSTNCGNPVSCNNGSPFSVVSANYSGGVVNYVFNASNLYNAKWQVKKNGSLIVESSIFSPTSNTLTASTGTLPAGNYEFFLLGVGGSYPNQTPCTGSAAKSFVISGGGCPSFTDGTDVAYRTGNPSVKIKVIIVNGCKRAIWSNGDGYVHRDWLCCGNSTAMSGFSLADIGTCLKFDGESCLEMNLRKSTPETTLTPDDVILSPNPNNGVFKVSVTSTTEKEVQLIITNKSGKTLTTRKVKLTEGVNTFDFKISEMEGLYLLNVIDGNVRFNKQVAKINEE